MAPVFCLGHTLGISFRKGRFVLESNDSEGELGHWVQVAWAAVNELLDEFGNI